MSKEIKRANITYCTFSEDESKRNYNFTNATDILLEDNLLEFTSKEGKRMILTGGTAIITILDSKTKVSS